MQWTYQYKVGVMTRHHCLVMSSRIMHLLNVKLTVGL
uniref:Uncharacterized protein n=1 Tax=Arundo donax TaxID=35708 RepID=A0A0A9BN25_ARUDO